MSSRSRGTGDEALHGGARPSPETVRADLKDVLTYALGGSAPEAFLEHLIRHRQDWDEDLWRKLEVYAYELRSDLARWVLTVDEDGRLQEERLPVL